MFIIILLYFAIGAHSFSVWPQTLYGNIPHHCPSFLKCKLQDGSKVQGCTPYIDPDKCHPEMCFINNVYVVDYQNGVVVDDCKTTCPTGRHSTSGETCRTCPGGWFQPKEGQNACIKSVQNEIQLQGWSSSKTYTQNINAACKQCPTGWVTSDNQEGCVLMCDLGQRKHPVNDQCYDCAVGKFNDIRNDNTCKSCAPGMWQNQTKQPSCKTCPDGYISKSTGVECEQCADGNHPENNVCTACPAGYAGTNGVCEKCAQNEKTSNTGQTACDQCATGTYSEPGSSSCLAETTCTAGQAGSPCTDCAAGQFQNENKKATCKSCPDDEYQDQQGKTECKTCAFGNYRSSTSCSACQSPNYGTDGEHGCKQCPSGKTVNSSNPLAVNAEKKSWYNTTYGKLYYEGTLNASLCDFDDFVEYNRTTCDDLATAFNTDCNTQQQVLQNLIRCTNLKNEYASCRNEAVGCPDISCAPDGYKEQNIYHDFIRSRCIGSPPAPITGTVTNASWHTGDFEGYNPCI